MQIRYTKWPEVYRYNKPTAKTTIEFLFELFAEYNVPDTLVSGNGMQFIGYELRNLFKIYVIKHIFTHTFTTYLLSSNGRAKRFVSMFKRAIRKARKKLGNDEVLTKCLKV